MKLISSMATPLAIASELLAIAVFSLPIFAQTPPSSPPNSSDSGLEILGELAECVSTSLEAVPQADRQDLETLSMQCVFEVVILGPDGTLRSDANERMLALLEFTGGSLPARVVRGQAKVPLNPIEDRFLWTVPVTLGDRTYPFLLDTGASNSLLAHSIAAPLGLAGTPIPNDLFAYMVVGEDCSEVDATLMQFPHVSIDRATVEGMTGMGLPQTTIPQQLSGVLGLDFLSGFDAIVDPGRLELQLLPRSPAPVDAIPLEGKMGVMTAQVYLGDRGPFTFLLDTGAEVTAISQDLADRLSLDTTDLPTQEVVGFCGLETAALTTLERVRLADRQRDRLDAVILQKGVLDFLGIDGILGQNFLLHYKQHWRFDPPNALGFPDRGTLILSPATAP
ncbi:retropepsin-like aspartic protease [Oxynema aestuarii]|jgi:predicted aspartyl protease|uniref:Clan AA aspartic protease n=1 Tax=Oxynema aestuarii AP17 TaxID=2064643 RepID=A0A6H1TX16_9CYAN|nr:retropepsin-like aspartic protease [Oxynema aestuarii]QIZ71134.1 clan AA aspartic protease [Oxynema aestuarii AP17]RMH76924.1 MAG: hypothetical protein D6680_06860 [Cyanobacteria bacterium J007]